MRTDEEILNRINEIKNDDWMGTETYDLIECLPFDLAKEFLRPETNELDWKQQSKDRDSLVERMLEYMPFAWDKACECRGLSAGRSMDHFSAWTWLVGDDFGDLSDYEFYGKDNLVKICEKYGFDHTEWDDGIRSNSEY